MADLGISVKEGIGTNESVGNSFDIIALMDGDTIVHKIPLANRVPLSKVKGVHIEFKK